MHDRLVGLRDALCNFIDARETQSQSHIRLLHWHIAERLERPPRGSELREPSQDRLPALRAAAVRRASSSSTQGLWAPVFM